MTATTTSATPTITAGMTRLRRLLFTAPMVEHQRVHDAKKPPMLRARTRARPRPGARARHHWGGANPPNTTEAVRDPQPGLARGGPAAPGQPARRQACAP